MDIRQGSRFPVSNGKHGFITKKRDSAASRFPVLIESYRFGSRAYTRMETPLSCTRISSGIFCMFQAT